VIGSLRFRSMRAETMPSVISRSSQEPRDRHQVRREDCLAGSFGSIRYAPGGEKHELRPITRSVPL